MLEGSPPPGLLTFTYVHSAGGASILPCLISQSSSDQPKEITCSPLRINRQSSINSQFTSQSSLYCSVSPSLLIHLFLFLCVCVLYSTGTEGHSHSHTYNFIVVLVSSDFVNRHYSIVSPLGVTVTVPVLVQKYSILSKSTPSHLGNNVGHRPT